MEKQKQKTDQQRTSALRQFCKGAAFEFLFFSAHFLQCGGLSEPSIG